MSFVLHESGVALVLEKLEVVELVDGVLHQVVDSSLQFQNFLVFIIELFLHLLDFNVFIEDNVFLLQLHRLELADVIPVLVLQQAHLLLQRLDLHVQLFKLLVRLACAASHHAHLLQQFLDVLLEAFDLGVFAFEVLLVLLVVPH